jgi:cellulose synthase/poly-beta-1,6-N-acetylglucosamine synthase-like glycosyltransferase
MASVLILVVSAIVPRMSIIAAVIIALICLVEIVRFLQGMTLVAFTIKAKDPIPMRSASGLRIAVLTTIVPGKEPLDLVCETLQAMKRIDPGLGNHIDVWLLDEGNDPIVRRRCRELDVRHFSRKGIAKWNTESGAHKAKTKHGNHNAWRSKYEDLYDIVAQMDPDHIPRRNFLKRTLGYFNDPQVAFVVAPQVYGNVKENWIARGSAFQSYIFHGIIQRGGNGLDAPLLIGTNHLYRTSAFKQINGYQDCIIEDHLTSMVIYSSKDTEGRPLKGVYTPDILAVGEGPTSFTDYFNQQKRWAYGIWEILLKSTPTAIKTMKKRQAFSFLMLQFLYPSIAAAWVASALLTLALCFAPLDLGSAAIPLSIIWCISIVSGLALFLWLRKFNLTKHERHDWGIQGMGLLLMCIPVYVNAAIQALMHQPLTYVVTAKGSLTSSDTLATFSSHINWIAFGVLTTVILTVFNPVPDVANIAWTMERIAVCLLPIVIFYISRLTIKRLKNYIYIIRITISGKRVRAAFVGK